MNRDAFHTILCLALGAFVGISSSCQSDRLREHEARTIAESRKQSQQSCPPSLKKKLELMGTRVSRIGKYHKRGDWTVLDASNPSAAFCISPDGYYLTAAHCVSAKVGEFIPLWTPSQKLAHPIFARIVWKPTRSTDPDLAILQGARHAAHFTLADPSTLKAETAVAHLGFAWCDPSLKAEPWFSFGFGRIREMTPVTVRQDGSRVFHIKHDSPCWFGDSGGPLLTADDQVAGVITGARWWILPSMGRVGGPLRCSAVLPDPHWLQGILDQDRSKKLHATSETLQ